MSSMFLTRTDAVLRGALDGLAERHRVYANNLANLETPGFEPGEVNFEAQLRQIRDSMASGPVRGGQTPRLEMKVVPRDQDAHRVDGNGVQADEQVMRLVENTLTYEALAQAARMQGELRRSVITEGQK
jgi:flagellar basal-body rod protein FlgB